MQDVKILKGDYFVHKDFFVFQQPIIPLSSAIHIIADWGFKPLREQKMTVLILQCFL